MDPDTGKDWITEVTKLETNNDTEPMPKTTTEVGLSCLECDTPYVQKHDWGQCQSCEHTVFAEWISDCACSPFPRSLEIACECWESE